MFKNTLLMFGVAGFALAAIAENCSAQPGDWITAPSYYTHDENTCQRVDQYRPDPVVVHTPQQSTSSYRHIRSALQVGDSIDIYHQVTQTGDTAVRPYGEWRFPYRPFSVPYSQWGPTFNGNYAAPFGYGFPGGIGPGYFPGDQGPFGPGGVINGAGWPQPWNDGYHPDIRRNQLPPRPFPMPNTNINQNVEGNDNQVIAN
jgi:hypothetical protein